MIENFGIAQTFQFGTNELAGLKIFLTDKNAAIANHSAEIGNCATCHAPPVFTDFIFHNTGATQEEYDSIHGDGAFQNLAMRQANYDAYLPPTPAHPQAAGIFETPPTTNDVNAVDLGLWNVFANPDFPGLQPGLWQIAPQLIGMTSPQIFSGNPDHQQINFSGTNGFPGGTYFVLSASNSFFADWEIIAINSFDTSGHFNFTVPLNAAVSGQFYRLSLALPAADEILPRIIGLFKTPSLRDLGHSDPYLHNGRMQSLEAVLQFFQAFSDQARQGNVRNPAPEMSDVFLDNSAVSPLAASLRSLNEDYTD